MARLLECRLEVSLLGSLVAGTALLFLVPFPADDWLLQRILGRAPWVFYALAVLHNTLLFSTPFFLLLSGLSALYVFRPSVRQKVGQVLLPPLPAVGDVLRVVLGEQHHARTPEPAPRPNWLVLFERGLFAGIAIIGAIGSGKTSCCMYPFAEQILSFGKRIGGLVLEVKGDFCEKVHGILERQGREADYIEINLTGSPYRYNPLCNDLDAYALAYGIATLLTSLFGKGREPFWQQAYTNMVKFIILLHRLLFGYVTLLDVYECAINPDLLKERIELGEAAMRTTKVALVDPAVYVEIDGLSRFHWERNQATNQMESLLTDELAKFLLEKSVLHQVGELEALPSGIKPIRDEDQREQFTAVARWFHRLDAN